MTTDPRTVIRDKVEEWRPVVGREGYFEVSSFGRVRSVPRTLCDGRPYRGKLLTGTPHIRSGHLYVTLFVDKVQESPLVHKLVAAAFLGPRPEGMQIRHLNGDPSDNRVENLSYGTASENVRDSVRHGTHRFAKRTHCEHGHELSPENTIIVPREPNPYRRCRTCQRAHTAAYEKRRREARK